jgi:hypothetical protein
MVIESILSREWGNWDDTARWRKGRRDLEKRHAEAVGGAPADTMALAEGMFFQGEWAALQSRGADPIVVGRARRNVGAIQFVQCDARADGDLLGDPRELGTDASVPIAQGVADQSIVPRTRGRRRDPRLSLPWWSPSCDTA